MYVVCMHASVYVYGRKPSLCLLVLVAGQITKMTLGGITEENQEFILIYWEFT